LYRRIPLEFYVMLSQACLRNVLNYSANVTRQGVLQTSLRCLNLQEYQSKQLMADAGIDVQRFRMAESAEDAKNAVKNFKMPEYVIKAQILAGGRGKGTFSNGYKGGVQLTKNPNEVADIVGKMVGHSLITKQTGPEGVLVKKVMVAEALDIDRETYLALLMDRESNGPVMVGSPNGGMDIEEVAEKDPNSIHKEVIDITQGLTQKQITAMAKHLGFSQSNAKQWAVVCDQLQRVYDMFCKYDCLQVEINPFGVTPQGRVVCFDAKLGFDDNAAFRQKALFDSEDTSEQDPRETEAAKYNLNYVGLDGNIGCLVNGAGLAMATMDIVQLCGGKPANFLDVGGNVKEEQVKQAFTLLTSDQNVKCIFVNIFGGIVNCETIAKGIIGACKSMHLRVPLVVRLEGTNVDSARRLIEQSGIQIITGTTLQDAAEKAVGCLKSSK
jgi:succinyl-CoA synthetase beta subunit